MTTAGPLGDSAGTDGSLDAFPSEEPQAPRPQTVRVVGGGAPSQPPLIDLTHRVHRSVFALGTAALIVVGLVAIGFHSGPRTAAVPDDLPAATLSEPAVADPVVLPDGFDATRSGTPVRVSATTSAAASTPTLMTPAPSSPSPNARTSAVRGPLAIASGQAAGAGRQAAIDDLTEPPAPGPGITPVFPGAARVSPREAGDVALDIAPISATAASPSATPPSTAAPASVLPPSPPSPAPPVAPPDVAPAPAAAPTDRQVIQGILGQYQAAFSRLDAEAAKAVWPGVNAGALERAFGQLERQALRFNACSIAIIGTGATARCQGTTTYVPRVGKPTERTDNRQWQIGLKKTGDRWAIVSVDSRE